MTTKTSSSFARSTAGASLAWLSSAANLKRADRADQTGRREKLRRRRKYRPFAPPSVPPVWKGNSGRASARRLPATRSPVTIPCSRVPSTLAATRQFSSETSKTTAIFALTVVVRPTRPSSVRTGISGAIPSSSPRLIVTVRHQVEESRETISAGTSRKSERSRYFSACRSRLTSCSTSRKRFVSRFQGAVLDSQCSVVALQFVKRFQPVRTEVICRSKPEPVLRKGEITWKNVA